MGEKIKVFASDKNPSGVGDDLTEQIEKWQGTLPNKIEIVNVHSNSNGYCWMVVLTYREIV